MCMNIFGDAELIIQQVNNAFQTKNIRLKAYKDKVWKLRDSFMFFELSFIPRDLNHLADSLVVFASMMSLQVCLFPLYPLSLAMMFRSSTDPLYQTM